LDQITTGEQNAVPGVHAAMSLNDNVLKPLENKTISAQELTDRSNSRGRVEPYEFERLLQRAMEILSIRAQSATPSKS